MERKALVSIFAAAVTAIISAMILYETLIVGSLLQEARLIGIFLASMFSHLTVIGRGIFVPTFLMLTDFYHPMLLGTSAGLGAAIGEVTTYYWGLGIREALEKDEKDSALSKWIEKYGFMVILLVAASPLPDTPIVLLAGSARLPLRKFLTVQVIGKTLFYSLGAIIGGAFLGYLNTFIEELVLSIIIVIASVAICIIVSWSKSREKALRFFRRFKKV